MTRSLERSKMCPLQSLVNRNRYYEVLEVILFVPKYVHLDILDHHAPVRMDLPGAERSEVVKNS